MDWELDVLRFIKVSVPDVCFLKFELHTSSHQLLKFMYLVVALY